MSSRRATLAEPAPKLARSVFHTVVLPAPGGPTIRTGSSLVSAWHNCTTCVPAAVSSATQPTITRTAIHHMHTQPRSHPHDTNLVDLRCARSQHLRSLANKCQDRELRVQRDTASSVIASRGFAWRFNRGDRAGSRLVALFTLTRCSHIVTACALACLAASLILHLLGAVTGTCTCARQHVLGDAESTAQQLIEPCEHGGVASCPPTCDSDQGADGLALDGDDVLARTLAWLDTHSTQHHQAVPALQTHAPLRDRRMTRRQ